ncbi:hypothetical protein BKA65DRAFT_544110 [Rhexocercosporidium sp. MPI-PUGE-AT-0058]|nr:hypothetical protein BKA65DRAFT_544110 [Rhexocercosporidium sp. MPI-PUGE-AT-0058]
MDRSLSRNRRSENSAPRSTEVQRQKQGDPPTNRSFPEGDLYGLFELYPLMQGYGTKLDLGGIVLKKALVIAHERSDRYGSISKDTFGVMFMGTPHRGSDLAFWAGILDSIGDIPALGSIRTQLLQDLQPKSACLGSICSQFVERAKSLRIFTIYERLKIKGLPGLVVDEHSAVMQIPNEIPIPIEADHRSMCRFSSKENEKYQMVFDCLQELVDDAVGTEQPYDTAIRSEFTQSLKTLDPEAVLRQILRASPGTCAWVLENGKFHSWRDFPKNRLLWISGIPGVGKTTLMRYLVENLRRWLQRHEVVLYDN